MKIATQIVHWPGKEIPACDEHAAKLKAIGFMVVGTVYSSPILDRIVCSNCQNETNAKVKVK